MKRKIIEIDPELCSGCGDCVQACHEGAIEIIDGKARLASDQYCDGLGNCLPECPTGAITIVERETVPFDEAAVIARLAGTALQPPRAAPAPRTTTAGAGCPGSAARSLDRGGRAAAPIPVRPAGSPREAPSALGQWPVQIHLVNPRAAYFQDAHLLVAADCTAYAYAAFHRDFIRGRVTLIGCPKLDDNAFYAEKLAEILANNPIRSIQVVRMEVPCCGGIVQAVRRAMLASATIVPYSEVVIGIKGEILSR